MIATATWIQKYEALARRLRAEGQVKLMRSMAAALARAARRLSSGLRDARRRAAFVRTRHALPALDSSRSWARGSGLRTLRY